MRIGLYGMPSAGKSYLLSQIDFIEVIAGSKLLWEMAPDFNKRDKAGRKKAREAVAKRLLAKQDFIMDGHYAFGDELAFTKEDGALYDIYIYLYIAPSVLQERMKASDKNQKYLRYDIEKWQKHEIASLRAYCHTYEKDFYVVDHPPVNTFKNVTEIVTFLKEIVKGYSCISYAKKCADKILKQSKSNSIVLFDGDKTLTKEDSSRVLLGYHTSVFDGNFYTGYQMWRQYEEFKSYRILFSKEKSIEFHKEICKRITEDSYILTSGHPYIWQHLASELGIPFFGGREMSAETKYFITKFLQRAGKKIIAYGDGMVDYFMLKQAEQGYLVRKSDGFVSQSLKEQDMEGLIFV